MIELEQNYCRRGSTLDFLCVKLGYQQRKRRRLTMCRISAKLAFRFGLSYRRFDKVSGFSPLQLIFQFSVAIIWEICTRS